MHNSNMKLTIFLILFFGLAISVFGDATKESELLILHQKALDAHLKSDIAMLLEDESDDYVVVSDGEVSNPSKKERESFLGPYLRATRFESYKDLIPPIIQISEDQNLGWVIAQVSAKGIQKKADGSEGKLEFVCAWIELYEKRNGRWLRTGNVSNFKK
jgi:hypothetical protein